ncbi:hypothetical protein PUNSTDRAFT_141749 [Punctularia strigosozonata HHB-11173 SS5]|uniref:uncharacterized protein n=1 Tax=Punctularia strigosozonata (strain HHB-11173) TaxID=741275 RepID=UPI00044177A1|nr:uncharacterized protein PUNSTDRAFT_141749 [Punctularia strigosozonata HHB-11173 SS5]EIN11360.1 hypothetical protein PUNSTDRAFT_141749 [Punctularia strigosozonata HHB-11173 SS5]
MEAKLQKLKVVDLKDILSKANAPAKGAKKADLVAAILNNPSAVDVYNSIHGEKPPSGTPTATTDEIIEPEQIEEELPAPSSNTVSHPPPSTSNPAPPASTAPASAATSAVVEAPAPVATDTAPVDEEAEKRRKRAARFGIPMVEPKAPPPAKTGNKRPGPGERKASTKGVPTQAAVGEDPEKLAARAARFGIPDKAKTDATTGKTERGSPKSGAGAGRGQKRGTPAEQLDPEELERRKKRAERFGIKA